MRPAIQSTDPDIRRYDRPDDMRPCPKCHAWMMSLSDFAYQRSCAASVMENDEMGRSRYSMQDYNYERHWLESILDNIVDMFLYEYRKRKVEKNKQELLPQFPNTLICTRCLHIVKHK